MSYRSLLIALSMTVILALVASVEMTAQEPHAVDRAELERVTAERAGGEEARREAVRSVLERPEVRDVAEAHGIEVTEAKDAVATLEGESLDRVFDHAQTVKTALAGGDDVLVISTTTLIIALLVLILISVA